MCMAHVETGVTAPECDAAQLDVLTTFFSEPAGETPISLSVGCVRCLAWCFARHAVSLVATDCSAPC